MSEELLKEWTRGAYGLLDNIYDPARVEMLDSIILDLSKVGITDLTLYNVEENDITVRYIDKGSQTFKRLSI